MYENYKWDELDKIENRSSPIEDLKSIQIQERALGDEPPEHSLRFIFDSR
jgi:hypothetical protein